MCKTGSFRRCYVNTVCWVDISVLYILKRSSLFSISYAFYWPFTTILLQQTALAAHFGTGLLNTPQQRSFSHHFWCLLSTLPDDSTLLRYFGPTFADSTLTIKPTTLHAPFTSSVAVKFNTFSSKYFSIQYPKSKISHYHSHRPFMSQNRSHRLNQNLNIQSKVPIRNILHIQFHNFLKIRNIASPTHLPHTSNPRFYRKTCSMMQFILLPFIQCRWSCAYQWHVSF